MCADHRARSRFRAPDLVAHHRLAPGPHCSRRLRGRRRRRTLGSRDLYWPARIRWLRGDTVTAALELIGVTSGYCSSPVVPGVSLQIAPGEILALAGQNGMGKSALLKTIHPVPPAWERAARTIGPDGPS